MSNALNAYLRGYMEKRASEDKATFDEALSDLDRKSYPVVGGLAGAAAGAGAGMLYNKVRNHLAPASASPHGDLMRGLLGANIGMVGGHLAGKGLGVKRLRKDPVTSKGKPVDKDTVHAVSRTAGREMTWGLPLAGLAMMAVLTGMQGAGREAFQARGGI